MRHSLTDSLTDHKAPARRLFQMGLENRWPSKRGSGVRIPLPPLTTRDSAPAAGIRASPPKSMAVHSTAIHSAISGVSGWLTRSRLAHGCLVTAAGAALCFVTMTPSTATAKPCQYHAGAAKKACVKQVRRDRMEWPPAPSVREIKKRVGWWWRKAERIAVCETGANWQHYPHGNFIGGLGMYRGTYMIGVRGTATKGNPRGYRTPAQGATKQEQIAVGYIVMRRFGVNAWGCGGA